MTEKEKLHFKTNVQLKSIIGKDLINDDNIAILELVKNSFDANAKSVIINFSNLKSNDDNTVQSYSIDTSRIIIQDNGVGMNLQDINDKWLNIAYSEKKSKSRQYNRMMAGAKGVGRFSCDRLGEYLCLYSKVENSNDYIQLKIDWKKFEVDDDKDKEIQSIELDYEILSEEDISKLGFEAFNHGVVLEIIKLRKKWVKRNLDKNNNFINWDVNRFVQLKKYLEKLINPNQAFETDDFGIFIKADEFIDDNNNLSTNNKFIGQVKNRIFDKLDFKSTVIESEIIDNGKTIYSRLKDKGETIFWIKEKNEYFPLIKNAKITLYYLNPYAKAFFTKQTGIRSVDYGSIFLFVNGFRIPPYGDVGNDWLGIDQRKAQGYARYIGLREFVGRVEILDSENDFQIISSREGIIKNDNFHVFFDQEKNKSYLFKTLRRLEKYVVDGLNWDSMPEEDLKRYSEIEKKIISGETEESELLYREDLVVKQKRTYELIYSIISAKAENVIELYINENLILKKVNEEKENAKKEFEQLLSDFENKKIDPKILTQILVKKARENEELENEIKKLSNYSTSELTSKAILDLQNYKSNLEEQSKVISGLKKQLERAEKERIEEEEKRKEAEIKIDEVKFEIEGIKKELTETKSQNLFLKSVKSQDLDEIVSFMHHIGISANNVENEVGGAYQQLIRNENLTNSELKEIFEYVSLEMSKILLMTKFATKANFKLFSEDKEIDLIEYILEYITNLLRPIRSENINISISRNNNDPFISLFKPIEFSIIFDNIISNSIKAKAEKVHIELNTYNDKLEIIIVDDGKGISPNIKEHIFEMGATTTLGGSGLGLFHVKKMINDMGGEISLINDKPTTFKIVIPK